VVQRLRVRYAKRGRLRFSSHRDVARAFERALRRAGIPIAFSAGFSPHPKVSYAGASPTGAASEAEYLEIGLAEQTDPEVVRERLDAALPSGIDVVEVVQAPERAAGGPSLAELIHASQWRIELPDVSAERAAAALDRLLAVETAPVERPTKDGTRTVDVRAVLADARVSPPRVATGETNETCATLDVVVQHSTPAVRPDDILTALRTIGALSTPVTPVVTRLAQGLIDETSPKDAKRLVEPFGH
jgi:radical SAM-linked protein